MAQKRTRGSKDNKRRLDAFGGAGDGAFADWSGCDCGRLQAVVLGITSLGGAVTFGLSRDMGAYMITLLLDGQKETLWFNGNADLDDELLTVIGKLESLQ